MAHWTIRPREGVEVMVDEDNAIRLEQFGVTGTVTAQITVQPDDIPRLLRILDAARERAVRNREESEEEEEE